MPDAGVLATILLIVGLFLISLELMIPSFGMIGIMAAVTLLISAWCAWQAWWGTSPGFFWTYAAFWVLGIPAVLGGMLFLLQNTSLGDRVVLRAPAAGSFVSKPEQQRLDSLVGQTGTAASMLMPGGMVVIRDERFHAESPGMVIDSGSPVEVIGIKGSRLVVKLAAANNNVPPKENDESTLPREDPVAAIPSGDTVVQTTPQRERVESLDFEIPES